MAGRRAIAAATRPQRLASHIVHWTTSARRPAIVSDHSTDRTVQTSSDGAPRHDWIALHNRILDRVTFATVACARTQIPLLEGEGVNPERIVHIPNGVPTEELREAAQPPVSYTHLTLPTIYS